MSEYLLNQLIKNNEPYVPEVPRDEWDDVYQYFDTEAKLRRMGRMHIAESEANKIFKNAMAYLTGTESLAYKEAQIDKSKQPAMMAMAKDYLIKFPEINPRTAQSQSDNDLNVLVRRLQNALFKGYVIQPFIDMDDVSDIKITAPDDIRIRMKGKAYVSNANFIDTNDMINFIKSIGLRNGFDVTARPFTRFVDKFDENYRLRFSITMPRILQCSHPVMHIRKIPKKKPGYKELINRGMFPEIVWEYIKDKAKTAKGICIGGSPGSGKSTLLNELIEVIPKVDECLCIQENDELFTSQRGWIFKTPDIIYDDQGMPQGVTMEALSQMALVEGCNRIVIGEAKGAEMRAGASLLNTGTPLYLTTHINSAREAHMRLADMVCMGSNFSIETAKSMVSNMDVIIHLDKYKVREILECDGYNRHTDEFIYRTIYKYEG